jgi:hypothetical protein
MKGSYREKTNISVEYKISCDPATAYAKKQATRLDLLSLAFA